MKTGWLDTRASFLFFELLIVGMALNEQS